MATVTSLTAARIQELLSNWENLGLEQSEINALLIQLNTIVLENNEALTQFEETIRPQLEADLAASSLLVSDLNDNVIPALRSDLETAALDLQNLLEVTLPSLQDDMSNTVINLTERPKVYVQATEPTNPDDEERDLVVGDTWFDQDDDNKERIWNGVEWTTFGIEISDFSLTAQKFQTSTHMIY